jgi:hypothetical protein
VYDRQLDVLEMIDQWQVDDLWMVGGFFMGSVDGGWMVAEWYSRYMLVARYVQ